MKKQAYIASGATFSECKKYRYSLWRRWSWVEDKTLVFIGLNPSTADEREDDPTIRRCIGFAKREGYGSIIMLNLFAFRATNPADMKNSDDPVGPGNDEVIRQCVGYGYTFVAVWGQNGSFYGRDKEVRKIVPNLYCLGKTKEGHPRHPLYLRGDSKMELMEQV